MRCVSFMDSSGVNVFLIAHRDFGKAGGWLRLAGVSGSVTLSPHHPFHLHPAKPAHTRQSYVHARQWGGDAGGHQGRAVPVADGSRRDWAHPALTSTGPLEATP